MKKILFTLTFVSGVIFILNINFPLKKQDIYGKYINMNFDKPICCVEAPHTADTLVLYEDNTFRSKFYGMGTYKLYNGINPEIEIYYTDCGQPAAYKTYFLNGIFEKPKISLNADSNHYYEKLD
ncbi:hypothetical protein [Chryseobacterium sp.]|uniref:hypothetical protein n=1 Tax=Chryseobacterium sp. TaxID=1871047 RepID=UPI001B1EC2EC|nr:hypothetical protein [Chryseobacterium sp.]MBO9694275.1 hypothetical protein [Chryseobacterium sp.]